mmetsp:Transcript_58040/g.175456  ORF Transcript_58040/g.175456 Transcript_58040/m.175456 type:complete len:523 (-) Transcript_58040:270-1838(-)
MANLLPLSSPASPAGSHLLRGLLRRDAGPPEFKHGPLAQAHASGCGHIGVHGLLLVCKRRPVLLQAEVLAGGAQGQPQGHPPAHAQLELVAPLLDDLDRHPGLRVGRLGRRAHRLQARVVLVLQPSLLRLLCVQLQGVQLCLVLLQRGGLLGLPPGLQRLLPQHLLRLPLARLLLRLPLGLRLLPGLALRRLLLRLLPRPLLQGLLRSLLLLLLGLLARLLGLPPGLLGLPLGLQPGLLGRPPGLLQLSLHLLPGPLVVLGLQPQGLLDLCDSGIAQQLHGHVLGQQAFDEAGVLCELHVREWAELPGGAGEDVGEAPTVEPASALVLRHGHVRRHVQVAEVHAVEVHQVPLRELDDRGAELVNGRAPVRGLHSARVRRRPQELGPHPVQVARGVEVVVVELRYGRAPCEAAGDVALQAQRPGAWPRLLALVQVLHREEAVHDARVVAGALLQIGGRPLAGLHDHQLLGLVALSLEALHEELVKVPAALARGADHRDEAGVLGRRGALGVAPACLARIEDAP